MPSANNVSLNLNRKVWFYRWSQGPENSWKA